MIHRLVPLLVALALGLACHDSTRATKPNVLLVCLDTVRADRLGGYGYREHPTSPALDRLAARAVVFETARASASWTKPSVPSFLSSTYPLQHGVYEGSARALAGTVSDVLPDSATTLAERFAEHGYETVAFVENAQLRKGLGFEQGFGERYHDRAGDAREIRWRMTDWLDAREDATRPFFAYLHFLDAHWPYDIPDEYSRMFTEGTSIEVFRGEDSRALRDALNDGTRTLDERERAGLAALYAGSIRSIDDQLARLFDALERRGLAQNTIVCVVADHGEEFLEHGRVGHGHGLWDNLLRVPFVLYVPGLEPRRVTTSVSLIDLAPTLCAAAELPWAGPIEGVDRLADSTERAAFAEHKEPGAYVQAYVAGKYKLVRRFVAPPSSAGGSLLDALRPGTRWKAECDVAEEGWEAVELSLRDDSLGDPIEIKGRVEALDASGFSLGGVRVRLAPEAEFYGELAQANARGAMLVEGLGVKARGRFEGHELLAEKVKLYASDQEVRSEIRGTVSRVESRDDKIHAWFGPLRVELDAETEWEHDASKAMSREDVRRAVELGAAGARAGGFSVEERLYDLARDPAELEPSDDAATLARLSAAADELARALASRTALDAQERALGEDEVEDLRALGYVR